MKVLLILYLSIGLTLLFAILPNKLHLLEKWFIWMVFVFSYTSFISVIVDNAELWILSENQALYWHFILTQIVLLPVIIMFLLHLMLTFHKRLQKIIVCISFIFAFLFVEQLLIYTNIITIGDWSLLQSIIASFIILVVIIFVHKQFRRLLIKEGVIKQ